MNKNEVLNLFKSLAHSQGTYGRILEVIGIDGSKAPEGFFDQFKSCKDAVDVVMMIEC